MNRLRTWWRSAFDVRPGEYARTIFMALYFYCSLSAVYVLKTFATSFFLSGLADVKRELPYLYLLVAIVGGMVAYFYTRLAMRISLIAASAGSSAVMLACLALLRQWSENPSRIVLYAFAVWSYLLATVFLSQGWLIAANLFDGREAKRLYALLGLGAILGDSPAAALPPWAPGMTPGCCSQSAGSLSVWPSPRSWRPVSPSGSEPASASASDSAGPPAASNRLSGCRWAM